MKFFKVSSGEYVHVDRINRVFVHQSQDGGDEFWVTAEYDDGEDINNYGLGGAFENYKAAQEYLAKLMEEINND